MRRDNELFLARYHEVVRSSRGSLPWLWRLELPIQPPALWRQRIKPVEAGRFKLCRFSLSLPPRCDRCGLSWEGAILPRCDLRSRAAIIVRSVGESRPRGHLPASRPICIWCLQSGVVRSGAKPGQRACVLRLIAHSRSSWRLQ